MKYSAFDRTTLKSLNQGNITYQNNETLDSATATSAILQQLNINQTLNSPV